MNDQMHLVCGLTNHEGKYLTEENFEHQLNVSGTSLSSKQLWTFEPEGDWVTKGFLRSPKNFYLQTTKTGEVSCETDEKQPNLVFTVTLSKDGRWSFKDQFGKILSCNKDILTTTMSSKDEYSWGIHVTGHPQCTMKSISQKRYVLSKEDEFSALEDIPWGGDAVVTMQYRNGKYALLDSRGRYLNGVSGKLEENVSDDSLFVLSLRGKDYNFRGSNGKHLTVSGPKKQLIASKLNPDNDTWFSLERSRAQFVLTAINGKKASIRQGLGMVFFILLS